MRFDASAASLVEEALRQRAAASGFPAPDVLPVGHCSWTQCLLWDERRRRFRDRAVVAGGMYHSVLIEGGGQVLTCGNALLDGGRPGLLGHGELIQRLATPTPIPALAAVRIRSVAAAEYHSVAVSDGGAAYTWGYGGLGRLGHGDDLDRHTPCEVLGVGGSESIRTAAAGNCTHCGERLGSRLLVWIRRQRPVGPRQSCVGSCGRGRGSVWREQPW